MKRRTFLQASVAGWAAAGPVTADEPQRAGPTQVQSETGVVYHRKVNGSDLMRGFPPPPDKRVTIHNWADTTDTVRWTHLHPQFVFRCAPVDRGIGPVSVLPRRMLDPDKVARAEVLWGVGTARGKAEKLTVKDWLLRSEADALVVLHDGHIVVEEYLGAMTPRTEHLLWSASKSVLASIVARQVAAGKLREEDPVTKYVPEFAKCGFNGATVRQLLDMNTGIFSRCFPPPEEFKGDDPGDWAWGTPAFRKARHEFAGMCRASGCFPPLPGEVGGYYDHLFRVKPGVPHGKRFYYTDPNPMALQLVLERATGTPYLQHLTDLARAF